jgi:hypothetical protein
MPLEIVQNQIKSGTAGGWTGTGITSSFAAANPNIMALGFAEANGPAVLICYTLRGDANLDRTVNALDFNALASGYGETDSTWVRGDFNYDGVVNTFDFNAIATNYNTSLPMPAMVGTSFVPEPMHIALPASLMLVRRRSGRR